jgi:hypothetical protein
LKSKKQKTPSDRVSAGKAFHASGTIRQPPPNVNAGGKPSSTAVCPAWLGLNFQRIADKKKRRRRAFF